MDKLQAALDLLGYGKTNPPACRSNLIHSILLFAETRGDVELATACESEIAIINAETRNPSSKSLPKR